MNEAPESRDAEDREPPNSANENESEGAFWHWFALAALLLAWIAEATMCAERGF